ncbi:APO protein 4, mitochondrial [Daucus carota subsp. sativus]|nr:PREDICTED: APO protein 4, mitochondrial-like [Daucus carota subsp. sativus]
MSQMSSISRTHRKIWLFWTTPAIRDGGLVRMYSGHPRKKADLKKLRPMIVERIKNRAKDYPIKAMIPVAEDVLKARVLLIQGVSTLLNFVPVWTCKFCPEVYIGEEGHLIKTCGGYRHRAKNQHHEWVKGSLNDIIVPVKTFHLKNMFQNVIEHQERFDFDRVSAVVELCLQAGAFLYDERLYSRHLNFDTDVNSFVGDAYMCEEDQRFVARGTLSAWETVKSGVQKLLLAYPTKVCEHCSEVHVGPSGHRARLCGVFKYQRWRGTHFWKKAEVDDLVPPNIVWFRRPQDPPLLLNTCREFYGHAPAVVDLCVKAGAIPPSKYLCMMKMQGLAAPLSAPAVVVD